MSNNLSIQPLLKTIKSNVTFVDWRTKRRFYSVYSCDICKGPIVIGRDLGLVLQDGGKCCPECVKSGIDLGFKLS